MGKAGHRKLFPAIAEVFSSHNGLVELGLFVQPSQNS